MCSGSDNEQISEKGGISGKIKNRLIEADRN